MIQIGDFSPIYLHVLNSALYIELCFKFQRCEHRHQNKISKGPKNQKIVKIRNISVKNRQTSAKLRYHKNIFKNRQTSARPKNRDFEIKSGCYRDVRNTGLGASSSSK